MGERSDLVRVDATGTVHPLGREASQELRARAGEWRIVPSPLGAILLRREGDAATLKVAGEITTPGGLCDVLSLAQQSSWSGELVLYEDATCRSIFFDRGNVIGAVSNVADERLGEVLYRFGVVTREQLEEIIAKAKGSGKRLGEMAIELEFVTPEELYPMMARQVEEVFFRASQVARGVFFFFDRFDPSRVVGRHDMNAGGLLMEAARRMDEMRFFREKIPSSAFIPVAVGGAKLAPPDDVAEVFAQCDGKRSIAEIGRRTGRLEFEVTRAVFQLVSGGFCTVMPPRPTGPAAIVELFNSALAEVHQRCDDAKKGDELRDGLARFATGGGIYDALFQGAGPSANGTFASARVARNLAALAGDDPDAWLSQQVFDYVGFALFQAGQLVSRDTEIALAAFVTALLQPLRSPESTRSPSRGP
jgi:Domain of unknown function (DUF4388)